MSDPSDILQAIHIQDKRVKEINEDRTALKQNPALGEEMKTLQSRSVVVV
jgi:hypothetical protein